MEDEGTGMFAGGRCVEGGEVCDGFAEGNGEEVVEGKDECMDGNMDRMGDWVSGVGRGIGLAGILLDWFEGGWCKDGRCGGGGGGW